MFCNVVIDVICIWIRWEKDPQVDTNYSNTVSRKTVFKFLEGTIVCIHVCMYMYCRGVDGDGVCRGGVVPQGCPEKFWKFPGDFLGISYGLGRRVRSPKVMLHNDQIFTIGFRENNPEIIPDSTLKLSNAKNVFCSELGIFSPPDSYKAYIQHTAVLHA